MTSAGPSYPTSYASDASVAPYDDVPWGNYWNIGSDNAVYASITGATYDTNAWSYKLYAYRFYFAIPSGATINGITVEIEGYGAFGTSKPANVQLSKNTWTATGDDLGSATNWATSAEIRTFGGPTELWGTTWTPEEINANAFAVQFANQATGNDADIYIDYIRVTVTYTEGGGGSFQSAWARNSNAVLKVM